MVLSASRCSFRPRHQCHSIDQNGQRERDISGCHSCNAHALSDKDLIHDVIEVVDHQCQ